MASVDSPWNTVQNQQRTLFFFSLFMTIANAQEGKKKKKKLTIPSNNIIHDTTIIL